MNGLRHCHALGCLQESMMNNNKVLEWDDLPKEIKLMMIDRMIENKELNEREITVALEIRKEIEDGRDG